MPDTIDNQEPNRRLPHVRRRTRLGLIAAGLLAAGAATGGIVVAETRPAVSMAPAVPTAIRALQDGDSIVTVRGRVAEVFGNKFILADASGRALVDTGREGDGATLVAVGQPVTAQGRFDHGFMHAAFLVGADGKVRALGPMHGPEHGGPGRDGPGRDGPDHGPRGPRHGPDGGPGDGPGGRGDAPPPPPVASGTAPSAVPAVGAVPVPVAAPAAGAQ